MLKIHIVSSEGMSLDIYDGQITCLLGHNGAGKTTLINILTGLISADSGQAKIYGYNIRDPIQLQKIRSMVGVCSQENTLIDPLSAREHLTVFAGLKGVPTKDIDSEVSLLMFPDNLFVPSDQWCNYGGGGGGSVPPPPPPFEPAGYNNFQNISKISWNPLLYRILAGLSSSGKLGGREVKTSALVSKRSWVRIPPESPVKFFPQTLGKH